VLILKVFAEILELIFGGKLAKPPFWGASSRNQYGVDTSGLVQRVIGGISNGRCKADQH
jgi:hypothetical protein